MAIAYDTDEHGRTRTNTDRLRMSVLVHVSPCSSVMSEEGGEGSRGLAGFPFEAPHGDARPWVR